MSGKKRVRGRDLAKEALWRGRVASQGESGLSVRAFCRAEGVGEAAFHWWRRELSLRDRESGRAGVTESARRRGGRSAGTERDVGLRGCGPARESCPAFVEVSCVGAPQGDAAASTVVEVVLRGGRVLRVGDGFTAETVSRLVSVLEAEPC